MKIAIVGATGLVGRTFLKVLEERNFNLTELFLFASKRSAGNKVRFKDKEYTVEELTENSFDRDIDIALFSAGGDVSKKFAPIAVEKGVLVIDNSSAWRMESGVPLIVPEVNSEIAFKNRGIIANPNCSTIQCMLPLKALEEKYGLKRVIYSTYQAVSGSGYKGIEDLENGLREEKPKTYPHSIVNNCLPHIDKFLENGYTKEEIKMINETKKILHDNDLKITATTVRVPVLNCHSESINVELLNSYNLDDIITIFNNTSGLTVYDEKESLKYPMPIIVDGEDNVFVGRIRRDFSIENGLNLWVVGDNLRKGAALNAVQILETLIK